MKKIFISTSSFGEYSSQPINLLESNGFTLELNKKRQKLDKNECLKFYHQYDGIIAGTELFDKEVLESAKKLKVISRVGVGIDNIDLKYSSKKGIKIFKSKTPPSLAVSELVLGLIIDLLRKVSLQNNQLKSGNWNKLMGSLLSGKTLGIIGFGNIGKSLIKITQGFNLDYLVFDIIKDKKFSGLKNLNYCGLNDLLKNSDIISIHLSMAKDNHEIISKEEFDLMKRDAILINTSRGEIIDEKALLYALSNKMIGGVGLDVYQNEPYYGPIKKFDNVILTPHIGSYAKEIRIAMEMEAAENLLVGFKK